MQSHQVTVTEKLDLIRFTVIVDGGISVVNAKHKPIDSVDRMLNELNRNIISFVYGNVYKVVDQIMSIFGPCEIGFFYSPSQRAKTIEYSNLTNQFILYSLFTKVKQNNDINKLYELLGDSVKLFTPIAVYDNITEIGELPDDELDLAKKFVGNNEIFSGNEIENIEGLVISCGKAKYQIIINNASPNIEKTTKCIYRDTLIENFAHVIMTDPGTNLSFNYNESYIGRVCLLFLAYISKTNLFTKMLIEPEDLLPPTAGYMGDIEYDDLPSTVKIICRGNELYKNILRILLVTFKPENLGKFDKFSEDVRKNLTVIFSAINSRS